MGSSVNIVVFPGDGIGPEITEATLRVLSYVARRVNVSLKYHFCEIGDGAISTAGVAVPQKTIRLFRRYGVALKGPVGESVLDFVSKLRAKFDLYINFRPVKSYPSICPPAIRGDIDIALIRENVEDVYISHEYEAETGVWKLEGVFTEKECRRIAMYAYSIAKARRKKLSVVHKANILRKTHGIFIGAFKEVSRLFPEVNVEYVYADSAAARLVRTPQNFDVIACPNFIGDILSDLIAEIAGGLGLFGSANINPERKIGIFEPVHGGAPDIAGKKIANPISLIRCASMMLRFISEEHGHEFLRGAELLDMAVSNYLCHSPRKDLPIHLGGDAKTDEIAERIINEITKLL